MACNEHSKHEETAGTLWREELPASTIALGRASERIVTKHGERPVEEELCRFAFAGVMPMPNDRARRLSAALRERIEIGLLRALQPGELMETRYFRTKTGRLEWHLAAFGEQRTELSRSRSVELSLGWQAALHELRYGYRFAPQSCAAAPRNDPSGATVRLQAGGRWLQASEGRIGFATQATRGDFALRLPTAMSSPRSRIFSSIPTLVLAAPMPLELCVRIEPISFTSEIEHLASALDQLRHQRLTSTSEPLNEAWCGLLEAWLQRRAGFRLSATVSTEHPLPHSFCTLAAAEVFGSSPSFRESETPMGMVLDLSNCVPANASLPSLFPAAEHLLNDQARRVFNIALPNLPPDGPQLGTANAGSVSASVHLPTEGRSRHSYIVGATGTGKSTLLLNLVRQDLETGEGLALIDPHGDLFEQVLAALPRHRIKDVVLIEPGRGSRVPGINFLSIPEGPLRRNQVNFVINEFLGIFDQLYDMRECGGPMFQTYFRNALLLLIESRCPDATLLDLARVFEDRTFREALKAHCPDRQVVQFWTNQAEKAGGETSLANIAPYITSKLNLFTQSGPIRPIVGQAKTSIDFRRLIDRRGILLVNLAKGQLGELDTRLLGMLLIGQLFSAALGRATLRPERRKPFHLYVDEFQNFVTDSVASLLAEARKFGLHLTLANQTLAQLNAHPGRQNLLETILGNVGNLILFRLGVPDAQRLRIFTEPHLPAEEIQRLPNFHAFARLLAAEGPVEPFVFATAPPPKAASDARATIATIRRRQGRWARAVETVEREIAKRFDAPRWRTESSPRPSGSNGAFHAVITG